MDFGLTRPASPALSFPRRIHDPISLVLSAVVSKGLNSDAGDSRSEKFGNEHDAYPGILLRDVVHVVGDGPIG